jgi:MFS family permease
LPRSPLRDVAATPHALYLLITALIGRLPTAMAALAIVQLVRLQGGDFALAGLMTSLYVLSGAVGQPVLGRLVDRLGQTMILVVSGIAGALGFVAMAIGGADVPALGLAGALIAGLFTPPLEPALRSLWPRMVPEGPKLKAAFSLDAGAQELVYIAGPLLTVAGIAAFGATGNLIFAAALGLGGTLAFSIDRLSRSVRPIVVDAAARVSPLRSGALRRVIVFQFGIGFPLGMLAIAVTAFGEQRDLPEFAGWALSANAVGALIGATASAMRPSKRPPHQLLALYGVIFAASYLPLAIMGLHELAWIVLAVLAGIMLPPTLAQVFDYVQQTTAPDALVEANAWVISSFNVGAAAGTTLAGFIAGAAAGASVSLMVLLAVAVTALSTLAMLPRFHNSADVR